MIRVEVVDPISEPRWHGVEALPAASLYHSAAWARVLAATYRFRPRYYLASDGARVTGGLPSFQVDGLWRRPRVVSLPFSDLGGPVGDAGAVADSLAAVARDAQRHGWAGVEIRGDLGSAPPEFVRAEHNDLYVVPLNRSRCDLVRSFSDSVRWGRKRALREGLTVERVSDLGALRDFYRLHQVTRRRLGVPVQPWRFFERIWQEFFARDAGFVVRATHAGGVAASTVFLCSGSRLYYKFSASDPRALASQPNSLVLWEAIMWARDAGLTEVDLGKTVRENTGLAHFKRSWGAAATPLPHYYCPAIAGVGAQSENSPRMRALRAVWRRLPLPLARAVGGLVYRALA